MSTHKTLDSSYHNAIITPEGKVICWGNNFHKQCDVPMDLEKVVAISCGGCNISVLTAEGKVICWGYNDYKQCDVPMDLENVVAISCGGLHTSALTAEGKVICWGQQRYCNVPENLIVQTSMVILM